MVTKGRKSSTWSMTAHATTYEAGTVCVCKVHHYCPLNGSLWRLVYCDFKHDEGNVDYLYSRFPDLIISKLGNFRKRILSIILCIKTCTVWFCSLLQPLLHQDKSVFHFPPRLCCVHLFHRSFKTVLRLVINFGISHSPFLFPLITLNAPLLKQAMISALFCKTSYCYASLLRGASFCCLPQLIYKA